jgi:adenylate cyclase class 2
VTTNKKRLEIEVKIKIENISVEETREKIIKNNFRSIGPRAFEQNIVFDTPDKKLKTNNFLLRLRKKGDKSTVTFKRPVKKSLSSAHYKIREETEVEVLDFEEMRKIFMGLGYEPVFIYEKYREVFQKGDVRLMVDETPIGNFIEIEGPEEVIDCTAQELGHTKSDYISDNYRTLFRKAGHTGHMQF